MKKTEKKAIFKDFGDYLESGTKEVANEFGIDADVTIITKGKTGKMPDSVFVLQDFAMKLAIMGVYNTSTFRVLFYFIAVSKYENFISADVETISEDCKLSIASVKRATKQLNDDNIIMKVQHPNDKRRFDYFINPKATWRGKAINRDKFLNRAKNNKLQLNLFKE